VHASHEQVLANLDEIRRVIAEAAVACGRDPADVTLVAAAKTVPAEVVAWVVRAGVRAVGENYVRELRTKATALAGEGVRWHYIGALQSGTAHHVADLADVVETLSGERAARRLAARAVRGGRRLSCLLEVDFTGHRAGVRPDDAARAAEVLGSLEGLDLVGLMTIPPITPSADAARPWFRRLRELRDGLRETHPRVLELSMGMSLDYRVAVEEGATMVRIGTALFGPRTS
jgi:pyridoxal phosphate enzyme (YggS family)